MSMRTQVLLLMVSLALAAGCAGNAVAGRSQSVTGPAGRLRVDDGGPGGLPVVFVHSFAGTGAHWASQLAHLRPTRRAVALDLRGHGGSDAPPSGDYAVESLPATSARSSTAWGSTASSWSDTAWAAPPRWPL
jgi:pimeloyl-ACP methyl ester carboxylesterase